MDAVVLDPVTATAEQQDAGADRDERRGRVLADRERRLALVVVEVVPEDVVVDDRVLLGRRELLRVQRVRHDARRVVVEAALRDRHVAHVGGAEAQRAAPARDVGDDRAHRLRLRRGLADVERPVVDVVGLRVEDPAADAVERVQAVDARLARDQVVHRVAPDVREEEPVGLVAARHEPVDGDLVGGVHVEPVLHAAARAQEDLLRAGGVADQPQVALLLAGDLHGLAIDAVAHADRVPGAGLVDGLLDRAEVAAALLLADGERLVRALGLGLDRARLLRLRIRLCARGGGRKQCGRRQSGEQDSHTSPLGQGSTTYQPAMPASWCEKTWQW